MCSVGFNAGAFRALKNNFALPESHLLDVFLCRVAFGDSAGVGEHRLEVARHGEENSTVKHDHVGVSIDGIRAGQEHNFHHNELSVSDQKPSHDSANDPANILKSPRNITDISN